MSRRPRRRAEVRQVTKQFDALAYSHRKESVRRIADAKKAETRERRIADTVEKVRNGQAK